MHVSRPAARQVNYTERTRAGLGAWPKTFARAQGPRMASVSLASSDLADSSVPLVLIVLNTPLLPSFSAVWDRARRAAEPAAGPSWCCMI